MAERGTDIDAEMDLVADRIEFIDLLRAEGPLETRDIVEGLDHSRSTVTRVLRDLRDADLVEKTSDGYTATLASVLAAEQYRRYETASAAVLSAKDLLAPIPEPDAPPVDLLVGADTIRAERTVPVRPLEAVSDRIRAADAVRAYLPTLVNTHLLRVWHEAVVARSVESDAVVDPDLLTVLKGQYPRLLAEMATADGFTARAGDGPPYGVVVTETDDAATVSVVVYESDSGVRGVVTNDDDAAVSWARSTLERVRRDAADVTADLEALDVAVGDGPGPPGASPATGHGDDQRGGATERSLPLVLETQGFVRLSESYFEARSVAPPAVSWQTGFTLAEVRAGHAVDRLDAEGRNLTDRLVGALRDGDDRALLGPPGSGKSTVCMSVACEWDNRGYGPVLYRRRGGDSFEATAVLEAYLRQVDGHALVVVEDAVRDQARAVFDVMRALDGHPDVTFLVDARAGEWRDGSRAATDARRDAYRRTAIERTRVPELRERECERFVERFGDLVGADPPLSGADLFSLVERGTASPDAGDAAPGDVLVAQHLLSQRYDPTADPDASPATALDAEVRQCYQTLTEAADTPLALRVAVLASALNAAGVPVAREYLYAVADEADAEGVEAAVSLLDGRLLFAPDGGRAGPPATYRTYHETWSLRFLETVREDRPAQRARTLFGDCVTDLLALADDADRREAIERRLDGRAPHLHRIAADPENWAGEVAARVFDIGRTDMNLAPLFGETGGDTIDLPAACPAWTRVQQAYWRGEMNRLYGDLERAEREFRRLGDRAEALDDPVAPPTGRPPSEPRAGDGANSADAEAGQRTRWRARSQANLGKVSLHRGEAETAANRLERALALYRDAGDDWGRAETRKTLGVCAQRRGDLTAATDHFEESLALFRAVGDRRGEANDLLNLGVTAAMRGALDDAETYFEESLSLCRDPGDRRNEAFALDNLGEVARKRGALDDAAAYHRRALSIFREIGDRATEATTLCNLGVAARANGEVDAAAGYLESALDVCRAVGDEHEEMHVRRVMGAVARDRGDLDAAAAHLDEALAAFREADHRHGEAKALRDRGTVARERGDLEAATRYLEESLDRCRSVGDRYEAGRACHALGRVARDRGDLDAARSWLADAAERHMATGSGDVRAVCSDLVAVCEQAGDDAAADQWCREAVTFAERTGRDDLAAAFETRRADLEPREEA